jgi:hypothetical protein
LPSHPSIPFQDLSIWEGTHRARDGSHSLCAGDDPSALSRLTGLTSLQLLSPRFEDRPDWQGQVAGALQSLQHLQALQVSDVPPGPLSDVLREMTALTHLSLPSQQPDTPLDLPHVKRLGLRVLEVQHLHNVKVPKLEYLHGVAYPTQPRRSQHSSYSARLYPGSITNKESSTQQPVTEAPLWLLFSEGDAGEQQALQQHGSQLLRWCNAAAYKGPDAVSKDKAAAAVAALCQSWCPDPSVLLLQGSTASILPAPLTKSGAGESGVLPPPEPYWKLGLSSMPVSRSALQCLPKGLTHLELW